LQQEIASLTKGGDTNMVQSPLTPRSVITSHHLEQTKLVLT